MLCTEIVSDIQNIFCTQHVLLHVLQKEELLTKIYLYKFEKKIKKKLVVLGVVDMRQLLLR